MLLGIEQNGIEIRGLCEVKNVILSGNKTLSVVCNDVIAKCSSKIICKCDKCEKEFKINKRLFFYKDERKRNLCEKCTLIATSIEKYGTESPNQSSIVKEKQAKTLEPYRNGEKKIRSSPRKHFKFKNLEELREKRRKIAKEKWAKGDYDNVNWSEKMKKAWSNPEIRQKYINASNTPEALDRFSNQLKKRWKNEEFARKIINSTSFKTSKFQKEVYKFLGEDWELEYLEKNLHYVLDIYNKETKEVVECFGDYWHCNPNKYSATYFHARKNMTAQQIWELDRKRIEDLENAGYKVKIVWEYDWMKNKDFIQKTLNETFFIHKDHE